MYLWPNRSMLPVVGIWMWCQCWTSLFSVTSMQTSQAWKCPGYMWAWFFQHFVGILRITGVTPLTTYTGEWDTNAWDEYHDITCIQEYIYTWYISSIWAGANQKPGMGYLLWQQNTWKRLWRDWHLSCLTANLTSYTSLSLSWIRTLSCHMEYQWVTGNEGPGKLQFLRHKNKGKKVKGIKKETSCRERKLFVFFEYLREHHIM